MTDDVVAARLDAELELVGARLQGARAQLRLVRSELVGVLELLDEATKTLTEIETRRG